MRLNWPDCWPTPPPGWTPPAGWRPPATWPEPPAGWRLWTADTPAVQADPPPHHVAEPLPVPRTGAPEPSTPPPAPAAGQSDDIGLLRARIARLEAELSAARSQHHGTVGDMVQLDDQRALQDVGIYRYHHPLEDSPAYKARLDDIEARIDAMIKDRQAVLAADMFTWNGSLARGRQLVRDLSRLMLRAYTPRPTTACARCAPGISARRRRGWANPSRPSKSSAR